MTLFIKLYSAYFHKFSKIVYENNLQLIRKQFNFILSFTIEIAYTEVLISYKHL